MISYCIAVRRVAYARLIVAELARKTSCPYEILLWLNVEDAGFIDFILDMQLQDVPVRVVGITPENIGMHAYRELFKQAKYDIIAQLDEDVTRISRFIAEQAAVLFQAHAKVPQIVADVWQDEWTNGSREPMSTFGLFDTAHELYTGRIDGWFSMYHRRMFDVLMNIPYKKYEFIGSWAAYLLKEKGLYGTLCQRFKVFHSAGAPYASLFGMLDVEIAKYRDVGRDDIADAYEAQRATLPPLEVLAAARELAYEAIDNWHLKYVQKEGPRS